MSVFKPWGDICSLTRDEKIVNKQSDLIDYAKGNSQNKHLFYVVINNDYTVDVADTPYLENFSKFDPKKEELDYIDNTNPNIFLYFRSNKRYNKDVSEINQQNRDKWVKPHPFLPKWTTLVFIRNKFYPFPMSLSWFDEIGNPINEQHEMWYEPLLFVIDTDLLKAQRTLKLKKLG